MKNKSRRFMRVALASALLVALLCSLVVMVFRNQVRSDTTYCGRPASYWSQAIIDHSKGGPKDDTCVIIPDDPSEPHPSYLMFDGDPAAVPLLIELTRDPDPRVRAFAARSLGKRKIWEYRIVAVLKELTKESDFDVRFEASGALAEINCRSPKILP